LQAKAFKDSLHAAVANGKTHLPQLLSYDFDLGLGIQKTMTNGLANHFIRATVVALWPWRITDQCGSAVLQKGRSELEITLATVAKALSRQRRSHVTAFPFDQHGKLARKLVVVQDGKGSARTCKGIGIDGKGHSLTSF
jgi:hypothetical protein